MEVHNQLNKKLQDYSEGKDSNLKIGDVVLITTKTDSKKFSEKYKGAISCDGVISNSVTLIPKNSPYGANVLTRSCLFRIENARKLDRKDQKTDSELLMAMGKSLTYGERVQLRHWHSKGFLAVNTHNIALEAGCLEIYISHEGNEDSWFEILPVNKLRKSGEVIKFKDSLYLKCSYEKSVYYLHFNDMTLISIESKTEINACGNSSNWKLKKYMNFDITEEYGNYVPTGDSFRIFHKVSEGYLTVSESQAIIDLDYDEALPEPKVFVQKGNKTSNSLWELQRVTTFVGGIAKWNEIFRIKHLATGCFLTKNENTLKLTPKPIGELSNFKLIPQTATPEKEIRFGTILSIRNSLDLLKVDIQEQPTKLIEKKSKKIIHELSFVKSKKDYSTVAFVLEDVPELNTAHVYKLSLMIPKLTDAYFYIKNSDLTLKYLLENPDKEILLKQTCNNLGVMLDNIRKHILNSNDSEVNIIKRQNSMREMGIINALIKLADLLLYKNLISVPLNELQNNFSSFSHKSTEESNSLLVMYLLPLEDNIYQLIYECIKKNPKNCRNLIEYEFILIQRIDLTNFLKIGKILREMFKYMQDSNNQNQRRMQKWLLKLKDFNLGTENIKVHTMYLILMKYLSQLKGVNSLEHQVEFKDKYLQVDDTKKIIKMHVKADRPCIELYDSRKKKNIKDIQSNNNYLSTLELVKLDNLIDLEENSAVFYLDELCKDRDYSKFVSSAIDFYTSLCLGRNNTAIETVKKDLYATPEYILLLLELEIDPKLKASFLEFFRVVFIDIDPYIHLSKFKPRCFAYIDSDSRPFCRIDKKVRPKPFNYFYPTAKIVEKFWANDQPVSVESPEKQLRLLRAYLKLTRTLLDLEILEKSFIFDFQESLQKLVMTFLKKKSCSSNPLINMLKQALEVDYEHSLGNRLSEVYEEVMHILNIIIIRRENFHVEYLCRKFLDDKVEDGYAFRGNLKKSMENNFNSILSKLEWKIKISQKTYYLDIYLLKLLFNADKNVNKEVRKLALELILADLNLRKNLKKELWSVEFLVTPEEQELYVKVYTKSTELYATVKAFVDSQCESKTVENSLLKQATMITLELLRMFKTESHSDAARIKFQAILRHSKIFKNLIIIVQIGGELNKILYRNSISLLYNFAFENVENQELLLPYVDSFLDKIDIGLGITKLLAQILSKNSENRKENRAIKLIFENIDKHNYEYHLLQLLRTFLYDEERNIVNKMQTDILKLIFNNNTIKHMHLHNSYYDYLDPQIRNNDPKGIKFHCEVMKCINLCIVSNRFGILQGRKLITLNNLYKTLKKPKVNKCFKKHYLKFLYQTYLTDIPDELERVVYIDDLQDLFRNLIIKDLQEALDTLETLVSLSSRGLYCNIVTRKVLDFKFLTFFKLIESMNPSEIRDEQKIEEQTKLNLDTLTEDEQKVLDHWNYMSGGNAWHSEKDGVFHILRDIFINCGAMSKETADLINEINNKLKTLIKMLEDFERKYKKLDFSNIIFIVNSCREAIPNKNSEDEIEDKIDTNIKELIVLLRDNILVKKLSLEEVFDMFDTDRSGNISKVEFQRGIKKLLKIQPSETVACYNYFARNGILRMSEFSLELRKYFVHKPEPNDSKKTEKPKQYSKKTNNKESIQKNQIVEDYEFFLKEFTSLCKDQNIIELVLKIRNSFVNPAIKNNDHSLLKEFVSKLGTAFKKEVHKIYLLQILKLLVPIDSYVPKMFDEVSAEQKNKMENIRKIQEILSKSGVLELALNIITTEHELEIVNEAVQLIISLLKHGNQFVQEKFLEILKMSDSSYLFSYIRLKLRQSRDRIVDRAKVTYGKNPEKAIYGIMNENLEQNNVFLECIVDPPEMEDKIKHVHSLILMLQLCCENCFSEFQHYIRSQEDYSFGKKAISINMVNEIAQYLINIKEVGPELIHDEEALLIIPQCYETLIDLCRGPCVENQLILGQRRKLYKFINNIIMDKRLDPKFFRCAIELLKVLLEGECNKDISMIMIEEINFEQLLKDVLTIYEEKIHNNRDAIIQENIKWNIDLGINRKRDSQGIDIEDWKTINSAFDIIIIFLKLKDNIPEGSKIKMLSFNYKNNKKSKPLLDRIQELGGRQESLYKGIYLYIKQKLQTKEVIDINTAFEYYLSLLASVEVDRNGKLEQSYFRVPAMIVFLSDSMRNQLLYNLNRNSHEEKVKSIFQHSELCQMHMHHLQQLSLIKSLSWWASKNKSIANINFMIVILVNLILLFTLDYPTDTNFNVNGFPGNIFLRILGVTLIFLTVAIYLFFIIENYPVILYESFYKPKDSDIYRLPSANKLQGTILIKYYAESESNSRDSINFIKLRKIIYVVMHPENFYNLIYILLVCAALETIYIYPFLLLDIVRRNENLRNILKAVTQNKRQLGLTVLLGLIIVYLFGVVGFLEFSQYFNGDCQTLLNCVTVVLYNGVRAGGGIGDWLSQPTITDSLYGARQVYDISFFIIVIIILLNIIFGIIIDTFGELRDKRKQVEEDIENICIICGREKYEFELRGSGWNEHIQIEHNLFSYLAYIIYVRRKPLTECDGLEKNVKNKIAEGDISFIPKTAMCLEKGEEDAGNGILTEIDEGIKGIENLIKKIEDSDF